MGEWRDSRWPSLGLACSLARPSAKGLRRDYLPAPCPTGKRAWRRLLEHGIRRRLLEHGNKMASCMCIAQ
jgi:hypothetical protein